MFSVRGMKKYFELLQSVTSPQKTWCCSPELFEEMGKGELDLKWFKQARESKLGSSLETLIIPINFTGKWMLLEFVFFGHGYLTMYHPPEINKLQLSDITDKIVKIVSDWHMRIIKEVPPWFHWHVFTPFDEKLF